MKRPVPVHKNGPVEIHQIAARTDNYIYLFRDTAQNFTAVIDPGVAAPVFSYCTEMSLTIDAIVITHHHHDHVDGNEELATFFKCPAYGLQDDAHRIPAITHFLNKESSWQLAGHACEILFTPGHTLGNVCFYFPQLKFLFSGETLFSFGCGRLFEGTPKMMLESLKKIRSLPADTLFFCGHEYTKPNLEFCLSLEPQSPALLKIYQNVVALRDQGTPTVPSLLKDQFALNPFLRWDDLSLKKALQMESATDLEAFTQLRSLRNHW